MANKTIESLIAINRSLVEIMHRRGLIPVGGAQMLLKDLADAAKNIEQAAVDSANRAVADVKKAVDKEVASIKSKAKKPAKKAAKVTKAAAKARRAAKPAAKSAKVKAPAKRPVKKAAKRR
jgi:hypothetical protein